MNSAASAPDPRHRLQRMEELFHLALPMKPEERAEFLQGNCADDPALVEQVIGLIAAESAIIELKAAAPAADEPAFADGDRWSGRVLGGYRLESLLGRGGMGVVYLASRSAGDLSQRAAVKLMAYHLQSTPAQQQFLMEREALAQLEHPNVTRLLDGGVTPEGLPYLVMEYVEGRRLDAVCDAEEVTLRKVAWLMMQLCAAVSYVHRNLILHRDLKPGNVMVTEEGSVKLLDFGALKGLGARFAGDSAMTQAGMRSMTLRYASPEQIRGEVPSTAMDVYSLGMILYRLMAGHLPAEMEELSGKEHLSMLEREQFAAPSRSGPAGRSKLDPLLAADLDAIALKAIRYRAGERYDSADALATDLRRALERRPVAARTGTVRYRTRLFVRRNRVLVSGAVTVALVLGLGVAAMAHEANVARTESSRADAGLEQERQLTHLLLFDYFDQLKRIPGSTDAQRQAVSQSLNYLNDLDRTKMTPALQLDSIKAYTEMGSLQGSPYEENLGDVPGAIATLKKAVDQSQRLLATKPNELAYLQSATAAQLALGRVYFGSGDPQDAVRYLVPAADASSHIASLPHVGAADLAQAASGVDALGDVYGQEGAVTLNDHARAIKRFVQAQQIDAAGLHLDAACTRCRRGVALEYWKIGMQTQDEARAKTLFVEGLETLSVLSAEEQASTRVRRMDTVLRQRIASADLHDGHTKDGLEMLEDVRQRFLAAIAADPVDERARFDLVATDYSRSEAFEDLGLPAQEKQADRELLEYIEPLLKHDATNAQWLLTKAQMLLRYGRVLRQTGETAEGDRVGQEGIESILPLAQLPGAAADVVGDTARGLVDLHRQPGLAVEFARRAVAGTSSPTAEQYLILAEAEQLAGMRDESVAAAKQGLMARRPKGVTDAKVVAELNGILQGPVR